MAFRIVKLVKCVIVTEVTVRSPFNTYSSQNSRYGGDKDGKEMISVDVLTIKLNTYYVFSMRTRNSTQEFMKSKNICITKKNRRKLFFHLLFRVRKRRLQSVLPGRPSVLEKCLLWVPQNISLDSYKACSKKSVLGPAAP